MEGDLDCGRGTYMRYLQQFVVLVAAQVLVDAVAGKPRSICLKGCIRVEKQWCVL